MNEAELTGMERYELAAELLAEMLNCGSRDVDIIIDMIHVHDSEELIDQTREFIEDVGTQWSFGAFVSGIEYLVQYALGGKVSEDLYDKLSSVSVDDNYVAWGGVADKGDLPLEVAEIFAEMCREGVTDERIERMNEAYESTAGIGEYDDRK